MKRGGLHVQPGDREAHRRYLKERMYISPSGCWLWQGVVLSRGYGQANRPGNVRWLAHRLSYEVHVGQIPDDLTIDHLCRVRHCINPAHLEVVSRWENVQRADDNPVAANLGKTHCPKGHKYTHTDNRGWRKCRECQRLKDRRRAKTPGKADLARAEERARLLVWARASQPHGIALCECCGDRPPTEYQHRKAKTHCLKAERWAVSNGLAVCGHGNYSGCHGERIHQQPTEAYANGWSVLSGQDPRKKRVLRRGVWVRFDDLGGMTPAPDEDEDESRVA